MALAKYTMDTNILRPPFQHIHIHTFVLASLGGARVYFGLPTLFETSMRPSHSRARHHFAPFPCVILPMPITYLPYGVGLRQSHISPYSHRHRDVGEHIGDREKHAHGAINMHKIGHAQAAIVLSSTSRRTMLLVCRAGAFLVAHQLLNAAVRGTRRAVAFFPRRVLRPLLRGLALQAEIHEGVAEDSDDVESEVYGDVDVDPNQVGHHGEDRHHAGSVCDGGQHGDHGQPDAGRRCRGVYPEPAV
mmetsp:Transcript_106090/g.300423  ORF Transcript_106090/g.300423 Transcript_106090/m.300423 type:complete len:246 (+) Transcript_106090:181-918(+)